MSDEARPEPDRIEGAPHPRETRRLFGQSAAEADYLATEAAGRTHHGWLLTGPRGIGKATLAWRIARHLLAGPAEPAGGFFEPAAPSLDIDPDHPVARRMRALSEPRLYLLRRAWDEKLKRLKTVLTVDEVRDLKPKLMLKATDGGRRAVIVDDADEMNPHAANALLKLLEEPPAGVTFLLVSHQPAQLLPTIRSRCRVLPLARLAPEDLGAALAQAGLAQAAEPARLKALSVLADGSVGAAFRLEQLDGLGLYARLLGLLAAMPRLDRPAMLALAETAGQRGGEDRFALILTLADLMLSRLARMGAGAGLGPEAAPGEAAAFARLAPDATAARGWAELAQTLGERARRGRAVNLDPAALVIDMVLKIHETASRPGPRG